MGNAIGIIVVTRLRKACTGAAVPFMNVKTEEFCFAVFRKTGYICLHSYTARFLIKPHLTVYIRSVRFASDISHSIREAEASMHKITSLQRMSE